MTGGMWLQVMRGLGGANKHQFAKIYNSECFYFDGCRV